MATIVYSNDIDFDFRVGNMRVRVVNISKESPDANWFLPEHVHHDYEVHIIEGGRGYISLDGEDFIVSKNELYITGPNVMHRQRSDKNDPMSELCIEFEIDHIGSKEGAAFYSQEESKHLIEVLSRKYTRPFHFEGEIIRDFYTIVENIEKKPFGHYLYAQTLIMKLIIDIIRVIAEYSEENVSYSVPRKTVDENRVDQIIRYIQINLNNSVTVDDVAKLLDISPKQINRIMQRQLDTTFHGYLYFFRYKAALDMLINTNLDISDIAFATGFSGTQQLYRTFRKYARMSPKEIRNKKPDEIAYLNSVRL
ncbi:MAG: AraC family transcriptional regulator [Defluviitaleaceae bacterium]|nr:AraC family transcriptional regulator [Defluviitaleaceae bacterium]